MWVAALMFRQASASEDEASKLVDALELPKSSCRINRIPSQVSRSGFRQIP